MSQQPPACINSNTEFNEDDITIDVDILNDM
jgi:hypothetical protein